MSELPITNYQTPILIPSEITSHIPDTPDMSNPYSYLSNPESQPKGDPELNRVKSLFWKGTGQLQSKIGSWVGLEDWEENGRHTQEIADQEYQEASRRLSQGEPSRIHGEYNRLVGYLGYAIGHVAGDRDMQERGSQRVENGMSEIDKTI